MRRLPAIAPLVFFVAVFPFVSLAQQEPSWEIQALNRIIPGLNEIGRFSFSSTNAEGTNGIFVQYGDATLMAESAMVDFQTGEAVADGNVRIESGDQIWVGEHIRYNFKTHQMRSEEFRTGKPPVFAAGRELEGDTTNRTYNARHIFVTTDDVSNPAVRVRASRVKIVPGKYVEMWNAVFFVEGVPTFYFPYYRRALGPHANHLNFLPGYSTDYGACL